MSADTSTGSGATRIDPDAALMVRVGQGETELFRTLVDRYYQRVVALMAYLLGRSDEAEDLAQDVFLRIYRARERYEPRAKFSTWLFTVANRVAMNATRSRKHRPKPLVMHDSSGVVLSPGAIMLESAEPAPESHLDRAEVVQTVREAVERLSPNQRTAVVLSKFEGMKYEEIGQVLGLSVMAVKSLLARARANLRDMLAPALQDG